MIDGDPHPKAASAARRISELFREDWLAGLTLDPPEKRFIDAPFGTLPQSQRIEASWLIENAAVLAWSMNVVELPPFYQRIDGAALSQALGVFHSGHVERIAQAPLRDPNEIVAGGRTYAALWWRFTKFRQNPAPLDFQSKLTEPDGQHLLVDGLQFIDRDLAVDGKRLMELSQEKFETTFGIIQQRYQEFRKLLGYDRGGSRITNLN